VYWRAIAVTPWRSASVCYSAFRRSFFPCYGDDREGEERDRGFPICLLPLSHRKEGGRDEAALSLNGVKLLGFSPHASPCDGGYDWCATHWRCAHVAAFHSRPMMRGNRFQAAFVMIETGILSRGSISCYAVFGCCFCHYWLDAQRLYRLLQYHHPLYLPLRQQLPNLWQLVWYQRRYQHLHRQ